MISRTGGYLRIASEPAPEASRQLEREGWAVLAGVLGPEDVVSLRKDIDQAVGRATTRRERTLIGLHEPFFYDG